MTPDRHLVVFAREPRMGRVKRRLAGEIGVVPAWSFQRRLLAVVLRRLSSPRWRCWLAVTPDGAAVPGRWPRGWRPVPQGPGDLGARMAGVMRRLPPGPAVIVGVDVPRLSACHVEQAFRALGWHDAVIGPAGDGGYWLVGIRRRPRLPSLFSDVRWSTRHALGDTLANLRRGERVAFLETLEDVDHAAALARQSGLGARFHP